MIIFGQEEMKQFQNQLIIVMRNIACESALPKDIQIDDPEEMYRLANSHDIAHFIGYAIDKKALSISNEEIRRLFQLKYLQATRRVIILENEIKKIKSTFEESGIDFIPLKGAVIRKLYPEQWMRVSSDIDILVHTEELKEAEQVLIDRLQYRVTSEGAHHDHVTSPTGFHVDLHFTLTERVGKASIILKDVWDRCSLVVGKKHEYMMDDDMFYLFHMFHAAAHFQLGGCCQTAN